MSASRAERSVGSRSVDGDSTSGDPAEKSDRRHDPDATLGTADTVGELGLAEVRRGSATGTAGLVEEKNRRGRRAGPTYPRSVGGGGRPTGRNDEATYPERLYFTVLPCIKFFC